MIESLPESSPKPEHNTKVVVGPNNYNPRWREGPVGASVAHGSTASVLTNAYNNSPNQFAHDMFSHAFCTNLASYVQKFLLNLDLLSSFSPTGEAFVQGFEGNVHENGVPIIDKMDF